MLPSWFGSHERVRLPVSAKAPVARKEKAIRAKDFDRKGFIIADVVLMVIIAKPVPFLG
jgi:hypothetical protein